MDATIVSVGHELITGACIDTNSAWLSEELTRVGVHTIAHVTVGDDVERICGAITGGLSNADLVIVSGGLGPTADDLTRQGVAAAVGRPLEENPEALRQIRAMFERWQRPFDEANTVQAMIPSGCKMIPNLRGTAPGIAYTSGQKRLYALPGVPSEMKAMFREAIAPTLVGCSIGSIVRSRQIRCFGMAEARVGELLADLMVRGRNPLVGTTASDAVITVRLTAEGLDEAAVERLLDSDVAEVRQRLGRAVFGDGEVSLAEVVAGLLLEQGRTVATAESCTGGLLAKQLTDISGSSAYFVRGLVTYSNEAKIELLNVPAAMIEAEGAVSEPVARAMAIGCRATAGTDFALAITGIAGPTGGAPPAKPVGLVFIGLADARTVDVKRVLLGEHLSRREIRDRSCKVALNLLRLCLAESPVD